MNETLLIVISFHSSNEMIIQLLLTNQKSVFRIGNRV